MPADDRSISEFPIAQQLLNTALVLVSNEDGQGGYDSYKATLTELGRVVLETQYTQDLGNMDVFTAIKNCRTLSGASDPTSQQGADGQLYVKYQTVNNVTSVTGLFVKLSGEWVEISTGGGGDVGIECTQAQYDAWEQAGTLFADTNYYITDGQSGGGVTIDDTTASSSTVYSSSKTQGVFDAHDSDFADAYDDTATYTVGDLCIYNNTLYKCTTAITTAEAWNASHWTATSIATEIASKQDELVVGTNLDDALHTSSYRPVTNHAITTGIRERAIIKVQTHTENITLAQGQNRFNYSFTATSGYTTIGMFVEWQDSAVASTSYSFSWIQFNNTNAYVDITAPSARTGGKLKYTLLEYKTGA